MSFRRLFHKRKRAGTAFVLGIVAVFLMGQALPKGRTVEAEKFVRPLPLNGI